MPLARLVRAALLFTSVLAFPSPARAQDDPARFIARIEGAQSPNRQGFDPLTLPQILERFHVPGVSIAVIKDFKIHWAKGYGVADVTTNRMVDTTTAFQAASISKPVTAMATVRLAQEGRLSLDQDINPLLPSWHVPESDLNRTQPVTPRSLLSHTSGSDDGFGFPGFDPTAPRPTVVQVLNGEAPSTIGPVRFVRPPFTGQKYSGGGTEIIQLALTDLTGQPFAELMRQKVLEPLGMTASSYDQPPTGRQSPLAGQRARDDRADRARTVRGRFHDREAGRRLVLYKTESRRRTGGTHSTSRSRDRTENGAVSCFLPSDSWRWRRRARPRATTS